ncbi:gliding motility protein [Flavobacterium cyanobacteriorum]|uniref:Gliding motility protein n=1 Tax=Flavobacterium cyanobacteriorum TaxID=2022802 RepID=A0A255YXZ1_9FLAO|nr:hypothetical protein [Flavobacterium cyanobacteriorum]OYQ33290.1 gliding motility protein [Flavobacterium cyanobacteriorum]
MKTSTYKYFALLFFGGLLVACSTKKNRFINRNYHGLTTEYNVLYNGDLALQAGLAELKTTYQDNFWEILPVERMQLTEEQMGPSDKKNPNFERSEGKATKAIQKHSMNIGGSEYNPQMDEAHLLLGKTRYYDNRFLPALEAFNYILYKHPNSDKIYEAKVWREKTNLRLENEAIAIKNLKVLIKEKELKPQVLADANATLAQAYMAIQAIDSAVAPIKRAVEATPLNEERARYRFILAQLYEKLNYKDSAYAAYQAVIDMNRKSPRHYVLQAHGRQAAQFDYAKGDTLGFMKKYRRLLEDRENRPYLDVINHQVGLFYDKQNIDDKAIRYYNKSLRANSKDKYLNASNHRNLAEIYFEQAKYARAGQYYDSTMVFLNSRTREYKQIKKKRDNLADVIKYEGIAQTNDSILNLVALSEPERKVFFEKYIVKLKKQEEELKKKQEAEDRKQQDMARNTGSNDAFAMDAPPQGLGLRNSSDSKLSAKNSAKQQDPASKTGLSSGAGDKFYFYNTSTVAYGKIEFQKRWGNRPLTDNWRWAAEIANSNKAKESAGDTEKEKEKDIAAGKGGVEDPRYIPEFYLKQLPSSQAAIDSLTKDRNFAYYQLGIIYKEKFSEYRRAADKLEKLLANNPEERLVLPALYNLYRIYEIIDPAKAETYKQQILSQYPSSRYAEIIRNPASEDIVSGSPEAIYTALYKQYEKGEIRKVLEQVAKNIETYTGEEIVSKFEMLKANTLGRLEGVEVYKQALNFVALTYPNSAEGKKAEALLASDVPLLEKLSFGHPAPSWKIIFKVAPRDVKNKALTDKILKFIKDGLNNSITLSTDIYTLDEDFVVIHGFNSRLAAVDAVSILKDYKGYKVAETPIIISSEDYKVVQVKKNLNEFLAVK